MAKQKGAKAMAMLVLLALVVPFAIYAVPAAAGADHSFVVLSGSMSPAIESGDAVIVEETDPETIQEGDVITFVQSDDETPTTHRVVDVEQRDGQLTFETKGDANEEPDPTPVPASNVIGTVMLTIPYIGSVILFANTTLGFILLVALPLVALAASEAWLLAKRYRNSAKDTMGDSSLAEARDGLDESDPVDGPTLAIHPTDLATTTILLALVTPYAAYVAIQLQTPLTFSVLFASLFTALAAGGLLLTEQSSKNDRSKPDLANGARTLSIQPTDLATTTILLALMTPYAAYVAIRLRTPLTFSVAFLSFFTALVTGSLVLAERFSDSEGDLSGSDPDGETATVDDAPPDAAPDGGVAEEVE